jgi:hypothetical protein
MCPHPTNPPREPQPHPLSEWPPSQETAKPPPATHPKRQPHDRTTPKAAAGPGRSEPWRRTSHPLAHSAKAPSSPEPPQRAQARSREAQTKPPTLQTPSPKETHRLFEKRTSRATNPWTAIVSSNPSSSSHEQSAQCPQQNERHHDRLAAIGDPIDPRPSNTTALPKRSTLWSRTGRLVVRPNATDRRDRSRLLRLNRHLPSPHPNRVSQLRNPTNPQNPVPAKHQNHTPRKPVLATSPPNRQRHPRLGTGS